MKTISQKKIILFGAFVLLPLSAFCAESIVVYEQNFDTGWTVNESVKSPANAPNNWWSNDNDYRGAKISNAFAGTHGNTLNLYSTAGQTAEQQATYNFSQNVAQGSFEFTIRKPDYISAYAYFGEMGGSSFGNFYLTMTGTAVLLHANTPGADRIRVEPWGGSAHSSTEFYTYKIDFDDVDKSVTVYLDGTPIISMANGIVSAGELNGTIEGMESGVFQIGRLGFNGPFGGGYSSIHIDDVVLTSIIPEPSTAALISGIALLLSVLLHRRFR